LLLYVGVAPAMEIHEIGSQIVRLVDGTKIFEGSMEWMLPDDPVVEILL
jgi:hypothetical protein